MAKFRVVNMDFWTDDKVVEKFSPEDKYFMLYLLTNPHSTQLGIYSVSRVVMAFELGYSVESISAIINRFQNDYKLIKYSPETNEIAIKNYLRHSIIKGGKPIADLLNKEINAVKNTELIDYVFSSVIADENLNETVKAVICQYYKSHNDTSHDTLYDTLDDTLYDTLDDTSHDTYHVRGGNDNDNDNDNVIVVKARARARVCAREGTNNNNDDFNPFGDGGPDHPTETLETYAANNIVNMNGKNMELLVGYLDDMPESLIRYAIDLANKCCKSGVPTYSYVEKILMKLVKQKIKTVEQAQALEAAREAEKERIINMRPVQNRQPQNVDNRLLNMPFTT